MSTNKKMRKKNQIPKYHALSSNKTMKKIQNQSMKNLLILLDTEEENPKILSMFDKKSPNLQGIYGGKLNN